MANITFDLQWREAMTDLLEQLEAEAPQDPTLAPQTLTDYACMYIKYLQIYNKLEESYDQMVHPQKRLDLKKALEACIGRLLEVKAWLVSLNDGRDCVNLDDTLVDLKLGPDVLEVRPPRYYRNDRTTELESRQQFLLALMEKYERPPTAEGVAADAGPAAATTPDPSAMSPEEAIQILQANERGRQARARVKALIGMRAQQEEDLRRQRMGGDSMSTETAAVRMQAAARGFLAKRRTKRMVEEELVFIGMKPPPRDPTRDPVLREVQNLARRKNVQTGNRIDYEECVVSTKKRVKEIEGQDMREMIQDRVNKWFLENRDPVTGNYPDFPGKDVGGSKVILNPPIVDPNAAEEENAKDGKGKKGAEKKDKGGDKKGGSKDDKKGKKEPEEPPPEPQPATFFAKHVKDAVQSYCATWQDKDETTNFAQRHDMEMVKATLRPLVFEEVRQEVDIEMAALLQRLKEMVAAEKAGGSPKKGKKGGKKGDKKAASGEKKEKKAKATGKAEKGGGKKGKKDPTGDRSVESLYAELVSNGIVQPCPPRAFTEYVGAYSYLGTTLEKAAIRPDPSIAQVRQLVTEYCVLPIGSRFVHENAPFVRSVLLYGNPGCGKTMLVHAACHGAGANLINLSPDAIAGRYGGKQVALMLHLAFKLARVMAPTVVYVDEVEKVFSTDKKKAKKKPKSEEGGGEGEAPVEPPGRIKKELLKEMKALAPGDRVVVVGCTSRPQDCSSAESRALIAAFTKHIHVPLPDYASLRLLWPALVERNGGGQLPTDFDLSTACTLSLGYTPGAIDRALKMVLTERRKMKLGEKPLALDEIMAGLYRQQAVDKEDDQALREWATKLPVNQPKTSPEEAEDARKKGGKDAKSPRKK